LKRFGPSKILHDDRKQMAALHALKRVSLKTVALTILAMLAGASAFNFLRVRGVMPPLSGSALRMSTAKTTAQTAIAQNKVMVFSKTYCPYCSKAKDALTKLKVPFEAYELDVRADGADIQTALQELTGQRTVPNIFVNQKHVGGCDATLAKIADGSFQKMLSA
jgi:glutaredoxin 3